MRRSQYTHVVQLKCRAIRILIWCHRLSCFHIPQSRGWAVDLNSTQFNPVEKRCLCTSEWARASFQRWHYMNKNIKRQQPMCCTSATHNVCACHILHITPRWLLRLQILFFIKSKVKSRAPSAPFTILDAILESACWVLVPLQTFHVFHNFVSYDLWLEFRTLREFNDDLRWRVTVVFVMTGCLCVACMWLLIDFLAVANGWNGSISYVFDLMRNRFGSSEEAGDGGDGGGWNSQLLPPTLGCQFYIVSLRAN